MKKKVLIVFAHPEPTSLNRQLVDVAVETLQRQGHELLLSDLYGMRWKAAFDADDFPARLARGPVQECVHRASVDVERRREPLRPGSVHRHHAHQGVGGVLQHIGHLHGENPARIQEGQQLRQQAMMIRREMQGGIGEDEIDRLVRGIHRVIEVFH